MSEVKPKLKELVEEKFKLDGIKGKEHEFATRISYLCRMYWMQRTDKVSEKDYELYRCLTNCFCIPNDLEHLDELYKPSGALDVLSFDLSHHTLEDDVIQGVIDIIKDKNKTGFFTKLKFLFSK